MSDAIVTSLLALHVRRPWNWVKDGRAKRGVDPEPDRCDHCRADWPCATVALIEAR